ncbi:MAG: hypothetical protein ACK5C4_20090, partial [Pseudanabaena sp.]
LILYLYPLVSAKKKHKTRCGGATPPLTLFGFYILTRMATAIYQRNTKEQNGVAILFFENLYWVWFLIRKSVATLS